MEKTKAKILDALRRDCKKGYTELSKEAGVSSYHLTTGCKEVERESRFVSILDFNRLGYPMRMGVYLNTSDEKNMEKFLFKNPYVNNAFKLKDYGFYAEVIFRDMEMLDLFFDELKKYKFEKKEVVYIVSEEKREGFSFFRDRQVCAGKENLR